MNLDITRKVKILFTIPNFDTAGSGKHMVDLLRKLDHSVYEPFICCDHDRGGYYKVVEKLGYPIFIRKLAPDRGNYYKGFKLVLENARFFRENKFDIIHSFHWKSDWFEPLSARIAGIPWVYTKKSMVWHKHWTLRNKLARFVFILNPEMADLYPISPAKSTCVGLGPDVDEVIHKTRAVDKLLVKRELGVSDSLVLLSVANLVPVKNIDYLIKALAQLKTNKKLHLFVVGDKASDHGKELGDLVETLGLNASVTLTGKVLDVEKYISIADLYIQPTSQYGRSEASGVACMEACAAAVPCIGSDVAGLRFVIGQKDLLFKPDDELALVDKLEGLIKKDELELKAIGKGLQTRMYSLFHMPNVARDHEKEYMKIVKN